jgi:hypothetical protein
MVDSITYSELVGKSDHFILQWSLSCYVEPVATMVVKYLFNKANFTDMQAELANVCWNKLLFGKSVDDRWAAGSVKLNLTVDAFVSHSSGWYFYG